MNENPTEIVADHLRFETLMQRYTGATEDSLMAVLCPLLVPIAELDRTISKHRGQSHYRASFTVSITDESRSVIQRGRTGKFVPAAYVKGHGVWREICKGRIIDVDETAGKASGEIYTGSTRSSLESALAVLTDDDYLEIDQYGASAKVLSGLAEYFLVQNAIAAGCQVRRMPEDMARHLGIYANHDFIFTRGGESRKVEAKSLWGTDTRYARLIHSTTTKPKGDPANWTPSQRANYYPTSSCKFATQDIFAVSLFLRTGNIQDFAFARSVPIDVKPYGLPRCEGYPEHVNQNPLCEIGNGSWFGTIDEVWNL